MVSYWVMLVVQSVLAVVVVLWVHHWEVGEV